jgi:hypothetical protein
MSHTPHTFVIPLQVYKVAKQWEGLPSCDEMAAVMTRQERIKQKRRVRREAAAAGVPVPPQEQQQQEQPEQLALPAAEPAAAAAAAGEGAAPDDDDDVEVVADLNIDQVCGASCATCDCVGFVISLHVSGHYCVAPL